MNPSIANSDQRNLAPRGSVRPLKRHYLLTKYLIALVLIIAVVLNGFTGYRFFEHSNYNMSDLLIIASYLSIVMSIYVLTVSRRKSLMH